jgi:hypothetical protein
VWYKKQVLLWNAAKRTSVFFLCLFNGPCSMIKEIRSLELTSSGRQDDSDTECIPRQLPTIHIREALRSLTNAHFGLG